MSTPPDFTIYRSGPLVRAVCHVATMGLVEVTDRLNRESTAGTTHGWVPATDDHWLDGTPNPCPCNEHPDTHVHRLFHC